MSLRPLTCRIHPIPGLILLLFLVVHGNTSAQKKMEVITVKSGKVKGVTSADNAVTVFKGIPYAQPPVGELRWKAPQPPKPWKGVRDASKSCNSCVQKLVYSHLPGGPWTEEFMVQDSVSEDCLYLNIWSPAVKATDRLPVMVYIHGGAFNEGSGSIAVYDGAELARQGIIVVTINYRLGVLGFLAHPELTAESPYRASGNYGILDCIAAVKWVKENIAAFGGDPAKITVAGQSAGARAVHVLTVSPLAKGVFAGAVAFSGSSLSRLRSGTPLRDAEKLGLEFADRKGATSIADLRAMKAAEVIRQTGTPVRFPVAIDGYLLTMPDATVFEQGLQSDVPTLTGMTADDAMSPVTKTTLQAFRERVSKSQGERLNDFLALYPADTDDQASASLVESARDQNKAAAFEWALFRSKTAKTPVYTYYFDQAIPWPEHPEFGAFHTGDIPYFFNNLNMLRRPWTAADRAVAAMSSAYLVNFVKRGNPNGEGLPRWDPVSPADPQTMWLHQNAAMAPLLAPEKRAFYFRE